MSVNAEEAISSPGQVSPPEISYPPGQVSPPDISYQQQMMMAAARKSTIINDQSRFVQVNADHAVIDQMQVPSNQQSIVNVTGCTQYGQTYAYQIQPFQPKPTQVFDGVANWMTQSSSQSPFSNQMVYTNGMLNTFIQPQQYISFPSLTTKRGKKISYIMPKATTVTTPICSQVSSSPSIVIQRMAATQTENNEPLSQTTFHPIFQLLSCKNSDAATKANQTGSTEVQHQQLPLITCHTTQSSCSEDETVSPLPYSSMSVTASKSVSRSKPSTTMGFATCATSEKPSMSAINVSSTSPLVCPIPVSQVHELKSDFEVTQDKKELVNEVIISQQLEAAIADESTLLKSHSCFAAEKENRPQMAIVKPHVQTGVIDNCLKQETNEPLQVSSAVSSSCKEFPFKKLGSNMNSNKSVSAGTLQNLKPYQTKIKEELTKSLKCESCGKRGSEEEFTSSKRFCSGVCGKRYNICCSWHVGLTHEAYLTKKAADPNFKLKRKIGKHKYVQAKRQTKMFVAPTEESYTSVNDGQSMYFDKKTKNSELQANIPCLPTVLIKEDNQLLETKNIPPFKKLPSDWNVQDVCEFISGTPGCSNYTDMFQSQEIDGQALFMLNVDHLMNVMGMKLGSAVKLLSEINVIKENCD